MPRRSRGHTYRRRPTPAAPGSNGAVSAAGDDAAVAAVDVEDGVEQGAIAPRPAPAPYARRSSAPAPYARPQTQTPTPRPSRMLVTDYGYVVSEMKRIGLTLGGLVVLLLIIARLLR